MAYDQHVCRAEGLLLSGNGQTKQQSQGAGAAGREKHDRQGISRQIWTVAWFVIGWLSTNMLQGRGSRLVRPREAYMSVASARARRVGCGCCHGPFGGEKGLWDQDDDDDERTLPRPVRRLSLGSFFAASAITPATGRQGGIGRIFRRVRQLPSISSRLRPALPTAVGGPNNAGSPARRRGGACGLNQKRRKKNNVSRRPLYFCGTSPSRSPNNDGKIEVQN